MIPENSTPHDRLKASHMLGFIFLKDLWCSHCDACSGLQNSQKVSINLWGMGAQSPLARWIEAWGLWVHCIACMFVKFHPLMLDSVRNTREVFGNNLDLCVSITMLPGASGFRWLCHVGFHETAENPCTCMVIGVPQHPSEEEFSPIWANLGQHTTLVYTTYQPRNDSQ